MWVVYALLGALFAAATAILAKLGLANIPSNLAVAIRTIVVLVMAWGIVFITGQHKNMADISGKTLWLLIASGVTTGLSWLFYFQALQVGRVSEVAPVDKLSIVFTMIFAVIFLGEKLDVKTIIGGALVTAGALVFVL